MPELILLAALLGGYGLGSIPFGLVLTRSQGLPDLRSIGSGNIGATNVLRTGRKDLAAGTLLLDGLKGAMAVWIALRFSALAGLAAALGAFLGHLYPVWLNFKGGKGVATFLGCAAAIYWPAGAAFAVVWLAVAGLTRYSSAAALAGGVAAPAMLLMAGRNEAALLFFALAALLFYKHRDNIGRLRAGTESRIGSQ